MFCHNCGNKLPANPKFCPGCGSAVHLSGTVNPPVHKLETEAHHTTSNESFTVASTGKRLINFILDRFIFAFLLGFIIALGSDSDSSAVAIFSVILFTVGFHIFFESIWQRTPAKWLTRTKVVNQLGEKPTFLQIVGRNFARWIPFEQFSFLFSPIGWHDSLSKTIVVPSSYTPEQVQLIDQKNPPKQTKVVTILIAVIIGIFLLGLLSSVVLLALNSARLKSRDAKRVADVRIIATGMELFFDEYGRYPHALAELIPKYTDPIPQAPTPNDGTCTPDQNSYNYKYVSDAEYILSFCLGGQTGDLTAGEHTLSSGGIDKLSPDDSETTPKELSDTPFTTQTKKLNIYSLMSVDIPSSWSSIVNSNEINYDEDPSEPYYYNKPIASFAPDSVTYTDSHGTQIDIYGSAYDLTKQFENKEPGQKYYEITVGGIKGLEIIEPLDNGEVTKAGSGGTIIVLRLTNNETYKTIIIHKQFLGSTEFENNFKQIISSVKFY